MYGGGDDANDAQLGVDPASDLKFRRGSVRWIHLVNFMTFDDVTFNLGPRMNVVLGPNGCGKSTIVCALCLGLGGSPKVL